MVITFGTATNKKI